MDAHDALQPWHTDRADRRASKEDVYKRQDVESLICATDAGREGELIFRLVYHQCGCKKPVERLWISSMEDSAVSYTHLDVYKRQV